MNGPEHIRAAEKALSEARAIDTIAGFDKRMRLAHAHMDMARLLLDVHKAAAADQLLGCPEIHSEATQARTNALYQGGLDWIGVVTEGGA